MERKTRFELATPSLARRCSTTEPLPLTAPPGGVPDCCALIIIIANIRRAVAILLAAKLWHGLGRPHPFGKLRTGLSLPRREREPLEALAHGLGRFRTVSGGATMDASTAPCGGMAEWTMAAVLKTVMQVTVSWVRIPLPPPLYLPT